MNVARSASAACPSPCATTAPRSGSAITAASAALIEARGLDVELMVRLGVRGSDLLSDQDGGAGGIAIPYLQAGEEVACKHRTLGRDKRFTQTAGGRQILWNVDCLADQTLAGEPLIVTEGELDAVAAIQAGFPRTVSVPGGAHGRSLTFLDEAEAALASVSDIVLAVDNDEPGSELLQTLARRLGRARCRRIVWPEGAKDLNDVLRSDGVAAIREPVASAQPLRLEGVYRLSELPPVASKKAHSTGVAGLDPHYRVRRGDFAVVTGLPGHGKSSLLNEIACNMAQRHGWSTVFASFEQVPQLDHRRALRTWHAGKLERDMSGPERAAADRWIDRHFAFVVAGEDEDTTLPWLLERLGDAVCRFAASLVVVDPWNEMDHHDRPRDMTQTEYVGFAIRQFRRFARKHDVHFVVVAHPSKMQRGRDGTYPVPGLHDISDSAHWSNKADVGVVVHRPDLLNKDETIIRVVKSRYHTAIGRPGEITATWNESTGRFA